MCKFLILGISSEQIPYLPLYNTQNSKYILYFAAGMHIILCIPHLVNKNVTHYLVMHEQ